MTEPAPTAVRIDPRGWRDRGVTAYDFDALCHGRVETHHVPPGTYTLERVRHPQSGAPYDVICRGTQRLIHMSNWNGVGEFLP